MLGDKVNRIGTETNRPLMRQINLEDKDQLELLLNELTDLGKERLDCENATPGDSQAALRIFWHEKLYKLIDSYDLEAFISQALQVADNHPSVEMINRCLDLIDALRQTDEFDSPLFKPELEELHSPKASKLLKEAFRKKLYEYQKTMFPGKVSTQMREAFRKKIELELVKMRRQGI